MTNSPKTQVVAENIEMTKHLMWDNEEDGWIAFEYKINGEHSHYEYIEIGNRPIRKWPKL